MKRAIARISGVLLRRGPTLLLVVPVGFNLWVLRAETSPLLYTNDSSVHMTMIRWAADRFRDGSLPIDGWVPYLSFGWPNFHHYPALPHILTGTVAAVFEPGNVYAFLMYLLLSTWPVSVYLGARLMGWDRAVAVAAALVSPLLLSEPSYGYEHPSYTWQGYGIFGQVWGMWLIPIAMGMTWRAVSRGKTIWAAALVSALTISLHLVEGYYLMLSLGIWVVIGPKDVFRRIWRAAAIGATSVALSSWFLVPFLIDSKWTGESEYYLNSIFVNSYGATKVLGWLSEGALFDHGRLPVISVLVAVGLAVSLFRFTRHEPSRGLVLFGLMGLILFFGRPTLGSLANLLPMDKGILFHRFIATVHLAGVLLAGVGGAAVVMFVFNGVRRIPRMRIAAPVLASVISFITLLPAWRHISSIDETGARFISEQKLSEALDGRDFLSLVRQVRERGDGRIYAGLAGNWGAEYKIGRVAVHTAMPSLQLDSLGFFLRIDSPSQDVETRFDESNQAHYDLFNIKYVLMPSGQKPAVPATFLSRAGRHTLWSVSTSGYLQVVDTSELVTVASGPYMARQLATVMRKREQAYTRLPTVSFEGSPAGPLTLPPDPAATVPGVVQHQVAFAEKGSFSGRVQMTRTGILLMKSTYHPRWQAQIDGRPVQHFMIAPSLTGVTVGEGTHGVSFQYQPVNWHIPLLLVGIGALGVLYKFGPRFLGPREIEESPSQ